MIFNLWIFPMSWKNPPRANSRNVFLSVTGDIPPLKTISRKIFVTVKKSVIIR
jgi:hypothetical protein